MSREQPPALLEGRRIYIGNLLYIVKPTEVESMLQEKGFPAFEAIHISIDPVSARNPGYCFVDFEAREDAERALESLQATIRGRPIKVGPCRPKAQDRYQATPSFQRWGDWNSKKGDTEYGSEKPDGPKAALEHFDDHLGDSGRRRVWVGGLPKMIDQKQNQEDIREIFKDHKPTAIGKRITNESARGRRGHFHYCFVDFGTVEEAGQAVKDLDGRSVPWGKLRVRASANIPPDLVARSPRNIDSQDSDEQYAPKVRVTSRAMASTNWRRAD